MISPSHLDYHRIDPDALAAVDRLQSRGSEAYLVGGSVRDLLLHRTPKDYDIATSARPQQVKRLFSRNCRIIGRRFKLAHLHFDHNRKILEVSTFRKAPNASESAAEDDDFDEDADLLITRDNEFGSAEEDALRRDFTVNALFYDSVADEIIDYVGGLSDVEARVIRTIGDPEIRFREDPVRIFRAIKFSTRLGFSIDPATYQAMVDVAPDLTRAAPPRLFEELLRLLRSGHSLDAFQQLRDVGVLAVMLPTIDRYLAEQDADERTRFWRLLDALDGRILNEPDRKPSNGLLLGTLFLRPITAEAERDPDVGLAEIAEDLVDSFTVSLRVPRRDAACLKRICSVQTRFVSTGNGRFQPRTFAQDIFFPEALELFELTCAASGTGAGEIERWRLLRESVRGESRGAWDDRGPSRGGRSRRERTRSEPTRRKREEKPSKARPKRKRVRKEREIEIDVIEPEAVDVSAFDVELNPRRAPSFGTIVEGANKKKKRPAFSFEDDSYKPPPIDDGSSSSPSGPTPPPPPSSDFGDW